MPVITYIAVFFIGVLVSTITLSFFAKEKISFDDAYAISVNPGDYVVFRVRHPIPDYLKERALKGLRRTFPDNHVVIIEGDAEFELYEDEREGKP